MKKIIKVNFIILVIFSLLAMKSFAEENQEQNTTNEERVNELEDQKQELENQNQAFSAQLEFVNEELSSTIVEVSPDFYRPTDVVNLWGDPSKAKNELGWNPTKTSFEELVRLMVEHDMRSVVKERVVEHINLAEYLEKGVVK